MVARGRGRELSSTYQSFADTGPTYSYLDLSRARSDESLLWSAGEEAAALVAELRASLSPTDKATSDRLGAGGHTPSVRSFSFTNLSSAASSIEDVHILSAHPEVSPCPNGIRPYPAPPCRCSGPQVPLLQNHPKITYRQKSSPVRTQLETFPPHSPRSKQSQLKNFGGSWRSLLKMGGMSVRGKAAPSAKKVAPPTVPEGGGAGSSSSSSSSSSSTCSSSSSGSSHRHSGSSLSSGVFSGDQRSSFSSSIGEESASNPPPSPRSPGRDSGCDHAMIGSITSSSSVGSTSSHGSSNSSSAGVRLGSVSSGGGSASPSHYQNNSQFTFPSQVPQFAHLMCPKPSPSSPHHLPSDGTYPYQPYTPQTSLEDQGIDVQSPGRSSPGSGSGSSTTGSTASSGNCRNSTTSLDSGRASSSTQTHTHRLSGQSYDSNSILRHSYHSSSSSLGSMEHDGTLHINVQELLSNGVPDSEVLRVWLSELHFEEYYEKFLSAGYDMPTISRMTPEDLNAIGITKPAHRKRLKAEISRLNISDGLPDFIPSRLEEWLTLLRLDSYTPSLKQQNYTTVEQVTQITWEDLEDVGITKLGHQKKVMLAIKRVKDILAGKKFNSLSPPTHDTKLGPYPPQESQEGWETYATLAEMRAFQGQYSDHHNRLGGPSDPGGQQMYRAQLIMQQHGSYPGSFNSPVHPAQMHLKYPGAFPHPDKLGPPLLNPTIHYRPDVVAVNVRAGGGKSRGVDEPIYGTYHTFLPPAQRPHGLPSLPQRPMLPLQNGQSHQRSLDDGDITPTNEMSILYEGGGTLPRPRTANKYRPVAKVTAKTRVDVHEIPPQFCKKEDAKETENSMKGLLNERILPASTSNTPQGTPKKLPPPPPPKRSNSIGETARPRGLPYGCMGVERDLQPEVTPGLPPPPPAPHDEGNHQHLPEDFPPPPPPLTCLAMASTAAQRSSASSGSRADGGSPSCSPDSEGEGSFRPRRNESNASFKSTSSTDSGESLPFANDNAGTIKQRSSRPHPPFSLIESRSSPRSSPLSSPALRRKEGIVLPTLRHPQPANSSSSSSFSAVPNPLNGCQTTIKGVVSTSPDETNDVLSDIGNMLANLTDELDAMLEQDLALKNKLP